MKRLQKYIIANLSLLFFTIFLPLFSIASVIFLIKLATYTSIIQLTIWEMTKLYFFILPEILFYTLPVTFFVAATLSVFKLSTDNEIVVLFALGIHPSFIVKTLIKPALILCVLLIFDFFILFPHATVLSSNFVSYKTSEAKFNLSASEFGHSFGNWLLYVGKNNANGTYGDIFLFNKNKKEEILIGAKNAQIINNGGILRLKLSQGEGYSYSKEKFSQINFETMFINDTLTTDLTIYRTPIEYWLSSDRKESKKQMFITDTLLSIFPLISLFLIAGISIVHIRQQQGKVYLYMFLSLALYYSAVIGLQNLLSFYTIPVVTISWMALAYIVYKKNVLSRF